MLERSHSFELRDKNYDDIQRIMENVLEKDLSFSTDSKRVGRSLLRINYFDTNVDKEQQKNNRITILKESEKRIYIQINGKLTDSQVEHLWNEFEKNLNNSMKVEKVTKPIPSKDKIVQEIKNLIDERGYIVQNEDVQEFFENFIEKYTRFPREDEINSIVKGYIMMVNDEKLFDEKDIDKTINEKKLDISEPVLGTTQREISLTSTDNTVLAMSEGVGRRKCPACGNDGLIHEMDDKSVILMDYPKIYAKKNCCSQCGYEWRTH
ncbi:MAG: hypothetical protein CEE43_07695 [Promethearchaeota archaeon Loki_b32]|nr:MAG: hypothetical protein CEE43_07695 [Candidatus Lokiarchaeota archaeon Loki_b32]